MTLNIGWHVLVYLTSCFLVKSLTLRSCGLGLCSEAKMTATVEYPWSGKGKGSQAKGAKGKGAKGRWSREAWKGWGKAANAWKKGAGLKGKGWGKGKGKGQAAWTWNQTCSLMPGDVVRLRRFDDPGIHIGPLTVSSLAQDPERLHAAAIATTTTAKTTYTSSTKLHSRLPFVLVASSPA